MRGILAAYIAALVTLAGLAAGGGLAVYDAMGPSDPVEAAAADHGYNVLAWEIRHAPGKWLYKVGGLFGDHSPDDPDTVLRRYFDLTGQIREKERDAASAPAAAALRSERDGLQNALEDIIEGRVTQLLKDQGLVMGPPPFTDMDIVFPPVDFEPDQPPRVLVTSPRSRIELDRSYLLSPGFGLETVTAIEHNAEAADAGVSALVVNTGGVATYPSVVSDMDSYESLIDTVIHEWLHQYLSFFPLGRSYYSGNETRTLNESVASIGGHELARLYFERYGNLAPAPSATPSPSPTPAPSGSAGTFDFAAEMRALRRQVEDLLIAGKIDEAERLMAQKRDEFEAHGVYIRRLNQAYFAFHGSYADTPASIDPIGPKLQTLLDKAGSAGEFVRLAARVTTRAELDALLARLGG